MHVGFSKKMRRRLFLGVNLHTLSQEFGRLFCRQYAKSGTHCALRKKMKSPFPFFPHSPSAGLQFAGKLHRQCGAAIALFPPEKILFLFRKKIKMRPQKSGAESSKLARDAGGAKFCVLRAFLCGDIK
ncbi:MAG: hypothetical protein DBX55_01160 [Verrucomicrobia bacterium]|nr:MAG: hypothetical protein DBX55_01160 [Verrucomicrobiota bacterium]